MTKICEWCGKEFETNYPRKKTCSNECAKKLEKLRQKEYRQKHREKYLRYYREYRADKKKLEKKICPVCGMLFTPSKSHQTNCHIHQYMRPGAKIPYGGKDCYFCLDYDTCDRKHCEYF